jgi:hypothetical protein
VFGPAARTTLPVAIDMASKSPATMIQRVVGAAATHSDVRDPRTVSGYSARCRVHK